MIMQWRKSKTHREDFQTEWQGIDFYLAQVPQTGRWHLLANGKHVKQNWHSAHAAMDAIDALQQKLILEAARQQPVAVVRSPQYLQHCQGGPIGHQAAH